MTKGFSGGQEFFYHCYDDPLCHRSSLLTTPAITLGIADSDKLKELHLGSFPNTRKDSPPNLSKSNNVKATATCLWLSGALRAKGQDPRPSTGWAAARKDGTKTHLGSGSSRDLCCWTSCFAPKHCELGWTKWFSHPERCLSPCTHPFPAATNMGPSERHGPSSPHGPAHRCSCSSSLAQNHLSTYLTFEFLYSKTPSQVCLMLCPDHLTTTHLCVSDQQLVSHEALQQPSGRGQCHEPHFQRGGQSSPKPPRSRDNPSTDTEPTKPPQAGVFPFLWTPLTCWSFACADQVMRESGSMFLEKEIARGVKEAPSAEVTGKKGLS